MTLRDYRRPLPEPMPKFLASREPQAKYYHRLVERTYEQHRAGYVVHQSKCNGLYATRGHVTTDDSRDFATARLPRDPCPKCFALDPPKKPEPEQVVWVRNADLTPKQGRALILLTRYRVPGFGDGRVLGGRRMTWYPVPSWFVQDYQVGPTHPEPFEEDPVV